MDTSGNSRTVKFAMTICMVMMFAMAVSSNMYATLVSSIIDNFGLSKTVASSFTAASSICSMGVMLFIMVFGDRLNKGVTLGIVCSVYGLSMIILGAFTNFLLFFVDFTLVGVCGSFVDSVDGAHMSDLAGENRSKGIAALHTIFAVGAIVSPNFAAFMLLRSGSYKQPYLVAGYVLLAVGLIMLVYTLKDPFLRTSHRAIAAAASKQGGRKFSLPIKEMLHSKRLVMLALGTFFNTGSYYLFTMLTDYLTGIDPVVFPIAVCSIIHTCYNSGMLVSRTALSVFSRRINLSGFSAWSGILCAIALVSATAITTPAAFMAAMLFVGLIGGANYTMRMILVCNEFPNNSASMMAIVNISASLGSTVFYMLFGAVADNISYTLSMVLSMCCYIMPAFFTFIGYGREALPVLRKDVI